LSFPDIWDQHDGIATWTPEVGLFGKIIIKAVDFFTNSGKEELAKHADHYVHHFAPRLFKKVLGENDSINAAKAVDQMEMLIYGIRKMYYKDFKCWKDGLTFTIHVYIFLYYFG